MEDRNSSGEASFKVDVSSSANFAEKWRKRQACDRCRRIKVRCEYEGLDNDSCKRCTKAGAQCVISTSPRENGSENEPRKMRKTSNSNRNSSSSKYAWVERVKLKSQPIKNIQERDEKISELKKIINDSWVEIHRLEKLKNLDAADSDNIHPDYHGDKLLSRNPLSPKFESSGTVMDFPPSIYREWNCVKTAIRLKLLSMQDAKYYYETFINHMTEFVFIPLDTGNPTKPIDVAAEEYPVLTLAMIVACATTTSVDHAEELNSFISRVYSERILINEDPSVEMVKALMVTCSYLKPRPHPKSPILLLYMLSFLFQLGHANDAKVLLANTADPVELELVRDRCRVYLGIYCMAVSFTLTMQRSDMFRFLGGSCEVTCQGLLKSGHSVDVKLVHFARLLAVGKEAFDFITTSELGNHPFPMVKAKVEHYRDKLQEAADMFNIDEDTKSSELFTNIATTYHNHILLVVYEHALTELVLKYDDSKQRKLMDFGYEVVGIAQKIVDLFASLTNGDTLLFPKMVYYRPLQAIVAIIRVQVIMWSKHLEAQVDIQRTFDKVKKAWDRAKIGSYTGVEMYKLLLKVEKWVSLTQNPERLGEDREIVLKENASRILKGVLFDVLSNKSGGKSGGSEPMTTAASTTSSYSANATQETTAESQVSWKDVSASMDTGGNLVQSMPSVLQQEEAVENQVQSLFDGNSNIDNFSSFNEFDPPMLNTAQMEVLLKELFTEY